MKVAVHADHSAQLVGLRAEEIHRWIDGFFDRDGFEQFQRAGADAGYDPYKHRKYRHCIEALDEACRAFEGTYTREQIRAVFECHLRDDYDGYLPRREDFDQPDFVAKYHAPAADEELEAILSAAELAAYFKDSPRHAAHPGGRRGGLSGFYFRIVWPTVLVMILFVGSIFTSDIPFVRDAIMQRKREMIRELTVTAASALHYYIDQEKQGRMTTAAAQQAAIEEASKLRYGPDRKDYFWITDMHPRMVMHPYRPDLIGRDLTDYRDREDKSGKRLFVDFAELVRSGGDGYLEYRWQWKDDPTRTAPKLSYVRGIPEWGWIIGTGIYIHDVEAEIDRLIRKLLVEFGLIGAALGAILFNVVLQSRRIELHRQQAEAGLREAKDRYRALVDSAGEGYLMELEGETLYSNRALQQLTGYSDEELVRLKPWALLNTADPGAEACAAHLRQLYTDDDAAGEFLTQILSRSGKAHDVRITTSRVFLSRKRGHIISFRTLARDENETVRAFYRDGALPPLPRAAGASGGGDSEHVAAAIAGGETPAQVVDALRHLPGQIRAMVDQGAHPERLREIIGSTFDAAIGRFVALSVAGARGAPPVPFAFLSLGSNARHEMTMFSDQDNALIFANTPPARLAETRGAFLRLADEVCTRLKQAGYPYCPGGIMAANPKWCLSLDEWKQTVAQAITQATPQSILDINVFLDLRCVHGDEQLARTLRTEIETQAAAAPLFFLNFARNCLEHRAPLNLLGQTRTESRDGLRTLNLKHCLKPIETFCRIYALKHAIASPGTRRRLLALREKGTLPPETVDDLLFVFDYLWQLRFYNQIVTRATLRSATDELDLAALTRIERQTLNTALNAIPTFQSRLSFDFLGVDAR